ncbi:MAG: 1-(5-phosphoribosyl)-5-[(5-phosphoribosylamino)methylideneamino]imidazole-4-carboxamide isomerase [Limnochordia bacterium]|jgi:phosphoribosylformimino-5-aminoimidazole carboxamide ribotide isomerase
MLIIPAIDLRGGKCVRLIQGDPKAQTIYGDDPAAVAQRWAQGGAKKLHVVDLDGAFSGNPQHLDLIGEISQVGPPIQVGGGLRTLEAIADVLAAGASFAIIGTAALADPILLEQACKEHPGQILVGIDARDGYVAVKGWTEKTKQPARELALKVRDLGVEEIIFTDISRDGMLIGPNLKSLEGMLDLGLKVIASGGVSSLADIRAIAKLPNISGIIIGKALYTGDINLDEALAVAQGGGACPSNG